MTKPLILQAQYRSKLEEKVADQLDAAGVAYGYEDRWVHYDVPARRAKYLPDFVCGGNIVLEAKGRFGGFRSDSTGARERQKLNLLKEQHPELDIRLIFQDARKPIYRGSKTTYAKWADDHGFKYSDKGEIPKQWLQEMKLAASGRTST